VIAPPKDGNVTVERRNLNKTVGLTEPRREAASSDRRRKRFLAKRQISGPNLAGSCRSRDVGRGSRRQSDGEVAVGSCRSDLRRRYAGVDADVDISVSGLRKHRTSRVVDSHIAASVVDSYAARHTLNSDIAALPVNLERRAARHGAGYVNAATFFAGRSESVHEPLRLTVLDHGHATRKVLGGFGRLAPGPESNLKSRDIVCHRSDVDRPCKSVEYERSCTNGHDAVLDDHILERTGYQHTLARSAYLLSAASWKEES
jgi:hypothetical protein